MRLALAAVALALLALVAPSVSAATASKLDSIEVKPGRVTPGSVATAATFSVTNKGTAGIGHMYVICALLDDAGLPKDVTEQPVTNIAANQTVYGSLFFMKTTENGKLTCRASEVD